MSTLPTVPGSATIPTESFADIQVGGVSTTAREGGNGSSEMRLPGLGSGFEGPTPTISSNASWRLAQAAIPAHQAYYHHLQPNDLLSEHSALLTVGNSGQYASYPSPLPLYRTQSSAPGLYSESVSAFSAGIKRPATTMALQTVFTSSAGGSLLSGHEESGTITPEELLRPVKPIGPQSRETMQDIAVAARNTTDA